MQYMLLIYGNEQAEANRSPEEMGPYMNEWFTFTNNLQESGRMVGGDALEPTATATTVRKNGDSVVTTDGPFAETKEQLGGYYIVEAENLDEAVDIASNMPNLPDGGSVEVRPIMVIEYPG